MQLTATGSPSRSKYLLNLETQPIIWGYVVLTTSGSTLSAAETLTMAMAALPQVTINGQNTSGASSDILRPQLPNGWGFGMSPEVNAGVPSGTVYEATGVPPDILTATGLLSIEDHEAGMDSFLDLALDTATPPTDDTSADDSASDSFTRFAWVKEFRNWIRGYVSYVALRANIHLLSAL